MKNKTSYFIKFFFTLVSTFLISASAFAQTTTIHGKIVDDITKEPLPFVNINIVNTRSGGTTDFDGFFNISTSTKADSIRVSYIGYNPITRAIKKGTKQELNFSLTQGIELKEVEITAGVNPAHTILKKVIANKKQNNIDKLDAYQYEVYNKVEIDLNNISDEYKKKAIFKPFEFIFDNIDTTNLGEKPFLPIFISESISDYYFRKKPKTRNEVIKASNMSGLRNESMTMFLGDMYQKLNFYNNNVFFFKKQIASPISNNGLFYYRYYLIDSMEIDGFKCYQIKFKPRRHQELSFTGNMWITDSSFALKQIELKIADDANINFITGAYTIQSYTLVDSATWMLEKEKTIIDFNPFPSDNDKKNNLMGLYGRRTASYKNFVINQPREDDFYNKREAISSLEESATRSSDYWLDHRHDSLSKNEQQIYTMVDTIRSLPVFQTWIDVVQLIVSGYKALGPIELGPYNSLYSQNEIEGSRFRMGIRTTKEFSKKIKLNAHLAYGLRDDEMKYGLGYKVFLSKKPRTILSMNYKDDNELLGQSQNAFSADNGIAGLFRYGLLDNLTRVKEFKAGISREWFQGFSTKVSFYNRELSAQSNEFTPNAYQYNHLDPVTLDTFQSGIITTTEIRIHTKFAYKEKYFDRAFERSSLGTKSPIIQAQFTFGVKGILGSDYDYTKAVINISDRIDINPFGGMNFELEGGKVWGAMPYPLLELPGGNETFMFDAHAFNGMDYFEFANDVYVSASVLHRFHGFFLNKIPLIRKLKWRELVGAKVIVGDLNVAKHNNIMLLPAGLNASRPYAEANIGVENIFKILRIDAVWRLTDLDDNNRLVRIKASVQFLF